MIKGIDFGIKVFIWVCLIFLCHKLYLYVKEKYQVLRNSWLCLIEIAKFASHFYFYKSPISNRFFLGPDKHPRAEWPRFFGRANEVSEIEKPQSKLRRSRSLRLEFVKRVKRAFTNWPKPEGVCQVLEKT